MLYIINIMKVLFQLSCMRFFVIKEEKTVKFEGLVLGITCLHLNSDFSLISWLLLGISRGFKDMDSTSGNGLKGSSHHWDRAKQPQCDLFVLFLLAWLSVFFLKNITFGQFRMKDKLLA